MSLSPKLPSPHPDVAGRNTTERKPDESFAVIAKRYQPKGVEAETTVATVSRFSDRLIDRQTGRAYSADEIAPSNASVNAAIAQDPAASLEAMGAASAVQGAKADTALQPIEKRMFAPAASAKIRDMAVVQGATQITVLGIGDSLGHRVVGAMAQKLEGSPGIIGAALGSLAYQVVSGTVVAPGLNSTTNFQPAIFDSGVVWNMSAGSVIAFGTNLGANLAAYLSSKCVVWAAKQPGGGTLTLEYSNDGGTTWTAAGLTGSNTVSTGGSASEVAVISVVHGEARFRRWRVTASGGPVNFVGALLTQNGVSGIIGAIASNGGLRIDQANQGQSAIRNQIASDLGQTVAIVNFYEGIGEVDQSEVNTFLSNWATALPAPSEILVISQSTVAGTDTANAAAVNGYWRNAIAATPRSRIVDLEELIPNAVMQDMGWNSPDSIHKDDEVWAAIGSEIYDNIFSGSAPALSFNNVLRTGSGIQYQLGSASRVVTGEISYTIPMLNQSRGRFGFYGVNSTTGASCFVESWWQPSNHAKLPNGVVFRGLGMGTAFMMTWDATGGLRLGPYDATFPSAFDEGSSKIHVVQDFNAKGCISCNHTSATATWLQRWSWQGNQVAEMREDGELNLKTVTTAAAYADDAAAATAGIPVGGIYRKTDGTVVWRQS